MDHLFNSMVQVEELTWQASNGVGSSTWQGVDGLEQVPCRLDLTFLRPGKDQPIVPVAGRAPDRIGVMFCSTDWPLKAGQRIVTVNNVEGVQPVEGIFEIRVVPDVAQDYSAGHHIEVQIVESAQQIQGTEGPQ